MVQEPDETEDVNGPAAEPAAHDTRPRTGSTAAALVDTRGRAAGTAEISWWNDGAGQWAVRVVGVADDDETLLAETAGFDLWAALRASRLELEAQHLLLCIQACCLNVWPAHQSRASGSGTRAFRYAVAGRPGDEEVVDLFAPAAAELVGRVGEQEEVALERQRRFTLNHLARDTSSRP